MGNGHDGAGSRRAFLKQGAAGAIAAAAGPGLLLRRKASADERGVLGHGEHTYEWVDNWAKMPEGRRFGYTHAVIEDAEGRIFVHNQSGHAVAIFDPEGAFMGSWGGEYASGAHGMQYSREDAGEFLYLAPTGQHKVVKTTLDGEVVFTLECPMESGAYENERQFVPTNVAIAPNGDFYVADGYGRSRIHQYRASGEWVRSWGGPGVEPGEMNCPHGLWVDTRGETPELVVADRGNVRLQYFSLDGEPLRMVTEGLLHPCHFDQRGDELLVPDLFGRITILDKDNAVVTHLGENPGVQTRHGYPNLPHEERLPGKFISPHDAMWDRAGNIFVAEWVEDGRVTKLRKVS